MMMIWRLLWCIELPTEIRRQIKVRAWNESESTRAEAKTRVVHGLLCVCVCVRVHGCLFGCLQEKEQWCIVKNVYGVLPYCFASTPHLSAVIHGINLYINCCHSMRLSTFSTDWAALLTCLRSSVDCVNIAFVLSRSISRNNKTKQNKMKIKQPTAHRRWLRARARERKKLHRTNKPVAK